jgi:phage terminase small subunit
MAAAGKKATGPAQTGAQTRPLSPLQKRFVDEYLIDLNATQAAIRAGYSAKTAPQQGPRLLTLPQVAVAIREGQVARSERTKVDADWLLLRLAEEAEADLADLYTDANTLKPVHEWPVIWRKGLVAGVEINELYEGIGESRTRIGDVSKLKLSDRIKRLELIGKHVGVQAFKDQVEHSGAVTVEIVRLGQ